MRLSVLAVVVVVALGCDRAEKKAPADEEGASVDAYCEKMLTLDEKTAKSNGHEAFPEGEHPTRSEALGFCKAMFRRAKQKEPKAYACFEGCMMAAKSREAEQKCLVDDGCLALVKNKKLFSNRAD